MLERSATEYSWNNRTGNVNPAGGVNATMIHPVASLLQNNIADANQENAKAHSAVRCSVMLPITPTMCGLALNNLFILCLLYLFWNIYFVSDLSVLEMCNFTNSVDQICTFRIALNQFILAYPLFKDSFFSYITLWICGFPLKISIVVVLVFMQFQQLVCYH